MDRKKRTTLVETGDVPIVGVLPAMWPGMFTVSGAEKSFRQDFVAIPPLEGPNGQRQTPRRQDSATGSHFSITTQCKNPRALMHWVDWFYSEEGSLTMSYGRENEGWSYAKEGDIAINGEQAKWALSHKRLPPTIPARFCCMKQQGISMNPMARIATFRICFLNWILCQNLQS